MTTATTAADAPLAMLLRTLKLPTVARHADEIAAIAERDGWTFGHYLRHLIVLEVEERERRRIERNQRDSDLPGEKTLATLDRKREKVIDASQTSPSPRSRPGCARSVTAAALPPCAIRSGFSSDRGQHRPPLRGASVLPRPEPMDRLPVAQFRFAATTKKWQLYRNPKWHRFDEAAATNRLRSPCRGGGP